MLFKVFCIRDSKAGYFGIPFCKQSHGEAEREFRNIVNQPGTPQQPNNVNLYPEDFDLYFLGDYDNNTGKHQLLDSPQHVIKAIQCVKVDQAPAYLSDRQVELPGINSRQ